MSLPGKELVGTQLGSYHLDDLVGVESTGAVYRATDTKLARHVGIKVFPRTHSENWERLCLDARSAAQLTHTNIAQVYAVDQTDDWNYVVFEYVHGESLREHVERVGPLPVEDVLVFAAQVAEALDCMAHHHLAHRDIKPSNIILQTNGNLKVEFGWGHFDTVADTEDITASGVTLGDFDYVSPEVARAPRNVDVRSDLYSLGCTMYYLLTGSPPYTSGNLLQRLLSHSSDPIPDPREIRPELDKPIVQLLSTLMAKTPEKRFASPTELIQHLRKKHDLANLLKEHARRSNYDVQERSAYAPSEEQQADGHELVLDVEVPDDGHNELLIRMVTELAGSADELHRALGGHGLKVSDLEILQDAGVLEGDPNG